MTTELPGYERIDEGVYRSESILFASTGGSIPSEQLILLNLFKPPTKGQIVEGLQKAAKNADNATYPFTPSFDRRAQQYDLVLKRGMKNMPEVTERLREGDEPFMNFIKKYTSPLVFEEGKEPGRFLRLIYGLLPTDAIKTPRTGIITSYEWYVSIFEDEDSRKRGYGTLLKIDILTINNELPPKSGVVKYLSFMESGNLVPENADEVIEALYVALSEPNEMGELPDISKVVLKEELMATMSRIKATDVFTDKLVL